MQEKSYYTLYDNYYIYKSKVSFLEHQIYNHYYCIKVCELREFDNKVHNYSLFTLYIVLRVDRASKK